MQTISTDITSLFHAGVPRAVIDAISVNVDVVGRTRRMINAAERRVPLDAVRILETDDEAHQ